LYDYGRPRDLHLDDAVAVSSLRPYPERLFQHVRKGKRAVLVDGPKFTLVHTQGDELEDRKRWILPLEGSARCKGETAKAGECLLLNASDSLLVNDARLLIAAPC
jgi:mannose-6-phosphate isomerase